jgi:hypothetical protein
MLVSALLLSVLAVASGCGPAPGPGPAVEQAESCTASSDPAEQLEQRTLEIGVGGPEAFAPLSDGSSMDVVTGGQGSEMVTPSLRIAAADGDADADLCIQVDLEDSSSAFVNRSYVTFERHDDAFITGAIFHPLADYDGGGTMELHAHATGATIEGDARVTVALQ